MPKIIRISNNFIEQSFEEWKQKLVDEFGSDNISYREVGINGWNRLDIVDGKPTMVHHLGPHWTDAAPCRNNPLTGLGKLIGTYNHNDEIGQQYYSVTKE